MSRATIDFGIELGESHSGIAVLHDGEPVLVKNAYDEDFTSSTVYISKHGNVLVGSKAKSRLDDGRFSEDVYTGFRRCMGSDSIYTFKSSGVRKTPEELSAEVLKSLKGNVLQRMGEDIRAAVITIPATFALRQCEATKEAAQLAGFSQCPLLQEPVAASLAYGFQSDPSKKQFWLVFDFGGGAFDVAVMKAEDGDIQVVNHGGYNFLGGADIDWGVIDNIIIPNITQSYNLPGFKRGSARWCGPLAKIKSAVENAKIDLSRSTEAYLDGCVFEDDDGNEVELDGFKLTQNQLSDITEPLIDRAIEKCKSVLAEKGLPVSAISKIILVGGPTLAPYFRDILADKLGIPIDYSINPISAVAHGAAIFASTQRIGNKARVAASVAGTRNVAFSGQPSISQIIKKLIRGVSASQIIEDFAYVVDVHISPEISNKFCRAIIDNVLSNRSGPLLVLCLPDVLQVELLLFAEKDIPGVDRTAYRKATPQQIIRRLTGGYSNKSLDELIIANYNFVVFKKGDWEEYFATCTEPIEPAKTFLTKDVASGGFSEDEITRLVLHNPSVVQFIASDRLTPNTAVALLISGRADNLWRTYNFSRFGKSHWRELFLHTNPDILPEASRPYIENKDGKGFSSDELLEMAQKCHALISSLDPNKIPFAIVYELYLTGKADLLWKNYPFASLDKSEWRKILTNPAIKIPSLFLEVAKSNRFKAEELCVLALKNERIHPFLVKLNVRPDLIINILLGSKADYIWENYRFSQFTIKHWERLILGLRGDEILRPRAMGALKWCKDVTENFSSKVLSKSFLYAPNLPIATIAPDVAVFILLSGKGHFLWNAYTFERLNDDQWLRLLTGTRVPIPEAGITFLKSRAGQVDKDRLETLLLKRSNLVEYVDSEFIPQRVAAAIFIEDSRHELWGRYDFSRFDSEALLHIIKEAKRNDDWPLSFVKCFKAKGNPFDFDDLMTIATSRPEIVIDLLSNEWVSSVDSDIFAQLINIVARSEEGLKAMCRRLDASENSWKNLPREKLMRILIAAPELRHAVEWRKWPYRDIATLAKKRLVFSQEIPRPLAFLIWSHFKSIIVIGVLTATAAFAIYQENQKLARQEAKKQYLNAIVHCVRLCDDNKEYGALRDYIATLTEADMAIVKEDLFVRNALQRLADWESLPRKIAAVSNEVRKVTVSLTRADAMKEYETIAGRCQDIMRMAGYEEYVEISHSNDYSRLAADVKLFGMLKKGVADDLAIASLFNTIYAKEFITEESIKECSNIVARCDSSLSVARSKHWISIINAEINVLDIVESITSRDKYCRELVSKMNMASSYVKYLKARTELIRNFGDFAQLKHLGNLCNINLDDLDYSYKTKKHSIWDGSSMCEYHFIGVVSLNPQESANMTLVVEAGKIKADADLYTLRKHSSGTILPKLLFKRRNSRNYKEDDVDYSKLQGAPLFVRREDYIEEVK